MPPKKQMQRELLDRPLRKAAAAIHVTGHLSLVERKLVNILLLNAYDNLGKVKQHTLPTQVLMAMLGWEKGKNLSLLKDALKNAMKTLVEYDLFETEKPAGGKWKASPLVGEAQIEDGICTYEYTTNMEKMLRTGAYALINVNVQQKFKRAFSLNLYENCLRFKDIGHTRYIPLDVWRQVLGADGSTYDEFKHFSNQVIKPAVLDVNTLSNIIVKPDYKKVGRKVTEMRFVIEENPQGQLYNHPVETTKDEIRSTELYIRLKNAGIGDRLAIEWIRSDPERAQEAVEDGERRNNAKQIRGNLGGYVRTVFESGSVIKTNRTAKQAANEPVAGAGAATGSLFADDEAEAVAKARKTKAIIAAMGPDELSPHVAEYVAQGGNASTYVPEEGRFKNVIQKAEFMTWLRPRLSATADA